MSLASLHRHIDRDNRRRERIAAGSIMARYVPQPDLAYLGGAHIRHNAFIKARGAEIPAGVVVIAARRAGAYVYPLLIEAFEGDRAAFASFPRLAHMLGATELQLVPHIGVFRDRKRVAEDLEPVAKFSRTALLSRPLAPAGAYDRSAIMATACAVAKARQGLTGEAWGVCLSAALKGVWTLAHAARIAAAH